MQNNKSDDKPSISKAKSFIPGPKKPPNDIGKRKSFIANDAVKSLDLALGRLKKMKLGNGEYLCASSHTSPTRRSTANFYIDSLTKGNIPSEAETASMMSMNFSHYELMRNLSLSNCNSDTSFSTTTLNNGSVLDTSRNEHLERYFRSAEMWRRNKRGGHDN
ncbi:unnamed protein product [Pieris macdunnoughi]|uniref:Uncharacterized protein n=1 Tax=Pieris macdunnoughi TaxID=345717 RepID=A0A821MH07_9NEOP|nr:unnamed protein product [Pieris macdunnoughi]